MLFKPIIYSCKPYQEDTNIIARGYANVRGSAACIAAVDLTKSFLQRNFYSSYQIFNFLPVVLPCSSYW